MVAIGIIILMTSLMYVMPYSFTEHFLIITAPINGSLTSVGAVPSQVGISPILQMRNLEAGEIKFSSEIHS